MYFNSFNPEELRAEIKQMRQIVDQFSVGGMVAATHVVTGTERILRAVFWHVLPEFDATTQAMIQAHIDKIDNKKQGVQGFTFGQLNRLFKDTKFFEHYEQLLQQRVRVVKLISMQEFVNLRNQLVHVQDKTQPVEITRAEAKFLLQCLELFIDSFSTDAGVNPFVAGDHALSATSPVFVGREQVLHHIRLALSATKPSNISILGERRMGKSSLLNQVVAWLARQDKMLYLPLCMQSWAVPTTAAGLFDQWHRSFAQLLAVPVQGENLAGFSLFLQTYARQGYRFVVLIDEFDAFFSQPVISSNLLSQLRSLANDAHYGFGYVLVSQASLSDLCHQYDVASSSFWNIFPHEFTLGLLESKAVKTLLGSMWSKSKGKDLPEATQKQILALSGRQAMLLQCVLHQVWCDLGHFPLDWTAYERNLRRYYQDWWNRRNETERAILLELAQDKPVADSFALDDLRARGLVTEKGQLFALGFKRFLLKQQN